MIRAHIYQHTCARLCARVRMDMCGWVSVVLNYTTTYLKHPIDTNLLGFLVYVNNIHDWFSTSCVCWDLLYKSIARCKKDVSPLLTHRSYAFLALTHQNRYYLNQHVGTRAYIRHYTHVKLRNVATYPCPNFNDVLSKPLFNLRHWCKITNILKGVICFTAGDREIQNQWIP